MVYNLVLESRIDSVRVVRGLKKWAEVVEFLKTQLDEWTTSVEIHKFSSDNKTLGCKFVTMSNLLEFVNSPNDKVLK